ncbi:MAG: hypothetical protein GXP10_02500 [Gammaproteobacteria bacterium]|nr:hypothetical protein [Gammaproteobacteria bacterium]
MPTPFSSPLLDNEDHWPTRMGGSIPGERVVFRGKDLFQQLNHMGWTGLLLYGISGREFSDKQIKLFEGMWTISASYPDPRVWNNRVAALAGTAGSTAGLAISAALAVSEANLYGGRPLLKAMDFLTRTQIQIENGSSVEQCVRTALKKHRVICGYGRPIVSCDERIQPLMTLAQQLGYDEGKHVKLAFAVEQYLLQNRWRQRMNIAALCGALAADQELSKREYYHYMVLCTSAGMFPCFIDSANRSKGHFMPLRCNRIRYEGKPKRGWT